MELDQKWWDSINHEGCYFKSFEFIKIIEDSNIENSIFWYVLVYNNSDFIGTAVLSSFNVSMDLFLDKKTKKAITCFRKGDPGFLIFKFLFCGLPISIGKNAIIIYNQFFRKEFLKELIRVSKVIARENKISLISFKEFFTDDKKWIDDTQWDGFIRSWSIPYMVFYNYWERYEDYLLNMRHAFRRQIKHTLRKVNFEQLGYQNQLDDDHAIFEVTKPSELNPEILYTQYMNIMVKATSVLELLTMNFFVNFVNHSSQSKVILLKKNDRILGYAIIIEEDTRITFMLLGIDEEYRKKYATYFNLLNAVIAYGIKHKVKEIGLGQTSYYVKSRIGGIVKPMVIYNYAGNKLFHLILRSMNNIIFPELKPPNYNVFRKH